MMIPKNSLPDFSRNFWLTLGMFVVVGITFGFYAYLEKQVDHANELRLQSYSLADELRQSSDDLTRMVRTYVVTGAPIYKQHYQEILDIRDGKRPRPVAYNDIYWDLVLADDRRPRTGGRAIPLLELMRQAGITENELARLAQAKANSDLLTRREFAAMALIESTEPATEANRIRATRMLNDASYHLAKYGIMKPIGEFYQMVEQRTLDAVRVARNLAALVRVMFIAFGLLLAFTLWRAYRALHATLGCSVDELQGRIARIGSGDFSSGISVAQGMENSVLGWLSATQINLAHIDAGRNQAEEELRQYKDHLEEEVQQRTVDLVLARNAAETANRAKSVFLSSMSHEFRTPLNAILGFSRMMRKDPLLPPELRENLDIINRSGENLLTLINDVLEMAKIEAGRVKVEMAPFDLGALVRDVADMMQMRAHEKGLQMLVDQSFEFPRYIKGDEVRLRQVLINLVGNAVKFTSQGGVTLRIEMRPAAPLQRLLIEVEDSGIGINPADRQKIFEPFVQLEQSATQQGTGLGLTITRQFVHLMGGTISVESTQGVGSTFRVELPVERAEARDVVKPAGVIKGEVAGLAPGQPEYRILIVEDQLESQLLLERLMKSAGLPVKVAENGQLGVELFQSWQPHLIWMDRRMPVMDGLEATRRIRELPGGTDVKIVAVTASAFTEQRDEMLKAGMDDFVRKPYRFNEIYECLTKHLGVQYTYSDAPAAAEVLDAVLTAKMLAVLPQDLRPELRAALESLDGERISAVIGQVASHDLTLHKTLLHLAENFDYPAILKALQTNR